MTDFQMVRLAAQSKGPLGDSDAPIPIFPAKAFTVTRTLILPAVDSHGVKIRGHYIRQPANITVLAFHSAEASARADEIQWNMIANAWGQGSKPWANEKESKISWQEDPLPINTKPLELR